MSIDANYDNRGVARKLPAAFKSELADIEANSKVGGVVPTRRRGDVLARYEQVRSKYDEKLARLRARGIELSDVDAAIGEIEQIFEQFEEALA